MIEGTPQENPPAFVPPVSSFTGPIAELVAQRMLFPPSRPGLLATLDQFEILRVLGGGGMGIVLLARDSNSRQDVAIKLVKSDLVANQNVVHRFLKEAGHLKRLRHTNVVPVQEISDRAEGPYFVMPYFEKGSLAHRIKPGQPLDTESILDIAAQVAEGLSFAHRSGIIHRDLKPANILLTAEGKACLADFGLARTLFNDTIVDVENRNLEGTAPYMSPAVAAGDAEDTRCDIYSFGAVLYEMLTGHPPYKGRGTKEMLGQIIAGPPKPIASLNSNADCGLVALAEGCMARELRHRYADMRDVLKDLQRIKENKPPIGQGRFQREAGTKLSEISRVLKAALVPACLAGIALLGWMLWHEHSHIASPASNQLATNISALVGQPDPIPAPAPGTQRTPKSNAPSAGSGLTPQTVESVPPAPEANFNYFHDQLAPFGTWVEVGGVQYWRPDGAIQANRDWRPYYDMGKWVQTDNGLFWQSDYQWGDIPFHYGRWALIGGVWLWAPDYEWGPSWVFWRHGETDGAIGWAPLPVGAVFVDGAFMFNGVRVGADFEFGLGEGVFTFVEYDHFHEGFRRWGGHEYPYHIHGDRFHDFYRRSVVRNEFRRDEHGRFVNHGIGHDRMERATHGRLEHEKFEERHPVGDRTKVAHSESGHGGSAQGGSGGEKPGQSGKPSPTASVGPSKVFRPPVSAASKPAAPAAKSAPASSGSKKK